MVSHVACYHTVHDKSLFFSQLQSHNKVIIAGTAIAIVTVISVITNTDPGINMHVIAKTYSDT